MLNTLRFDLLSLDIGVPAAGRSAIATRSILTDEHFQR